MNAVDSGRKLLSEYLLPGVVKHLSDRFVFEASGKEDVLLVTDPDGQGEPIKVHVRGEALILSVGDARNQRAEFDGDRQLAVALLVGRLSQAMSGVDQRPNRGHWRTFGSRPEHVWKRYSGVPGSGVTFGHPIASGAGVYEFDITGLGHLSLHDAQLVEVAEEGQRLVLVFEHRLGRATYDFVVTGWFAREEDGDGDGDGELVSALSWDGGVVFDFATASLGWTFFASRLSVTFEPR